MWRIQSFLIALWISSPHSHFYIFNQLPTTTPPPHTQPSQLNADGRYFRAPPKPQVPDDCIESFYLQIYVNSILPVLKSGKETWMSLSDSVNCGTCFISSIFNQIVHIYGMLWNILIPLFVACFVFFFSSKSEWTKEIILWLFPVVWGTI